MKKFFDFHFQIQKKVGLFPLFINQSLRAVAISFFSLFSSIYIYKTILALFSQPKLSILGVFVFFLGLYVFKLLASLMAEELALKLGLKRQVYIGQFLLAFCFVGLLLSLKWPGLVFLAAWFWGLSAGFYWFGRHGLMIKIGRYGFFGEELGTAGLWQTFLLAGMPFLGGVLISLGGYQFLFGASLVFVFLSFWAVSSVEERKTFHDTSIRETLNLFKTHQKMFLSYAGTAGAWAVYSMTVPLYLFLILEKEFFLGSFFSLSMLAVALLKLITGRWVDIGGKTKVLSYGAFFQFLTWLGRSFSASVAIFFILDLFDRATTSMVEIPLDVLSYEKALDGRSTGRAVLFREVAFCLGQIFVCLFLIMITLLGAQLRLAFFLGALLSLTPLLIVRKGA